jgi:hypothetical protein
MKENINPSPSVGLGNTRILTGYVEKYFPNANAIGISGIMSQTRPCPIHCHAPYTCFMSKYELVAMIKCTSFTPTLVAMLSLSPSWIGIRPRGG